MNKHFPNKLGNLATLVVVIAASCAASNASAGDAGLRTVGPRSYETRKPSDISNSKTRLAANCALTASDRVVGAQRVWTQHGVISVGGHVERVQTTECR